MNDVAVLRPHSLLDCATLARELRVSRTAAEAIMRHVPKIHVEGLRKTYVRWSDVERYLEERTRAA